MTREFITAVGALIVFFLILLLLIVFLLGAAL